MRTHGKLFYFEKRKKLTIQVTKSLIWYFRKLRVHVVIDYADMCLKMMMMMMMMTSQTQCRCSCWPSEHVVRVVIDYLDTTMISPTLSEDFRGFSQILKEQSSEKKYLGVLKHPITIIQKYFLKTYLQNKLFVPIVVDRRFSNFAIEYLRENGNVRKTTFACSHGA